MCICPPDWEGQYIFSSYQKQTNLLILGTICHIAKQTFCRSNPCLNGGTCVNTGDYYQCICKDGFEGSNCQDDVNDCIPQPCQNGGKCIDGVNWFLCECAPGFTGPDCKINVNDCASNPCGYGGTCLDRIDDFDCICSSGRSGKRCQSAFSFFSSVFFYKVKFSCRCITSPITRKLRLGRAHFGKQYNLATRMQHLSLRERPCQMY